MRLTITDPKESWVPSPCARIPEFQVIELRSNYTELPLVPEENAWQDAIPAPVPGSVHTALYENGVIPDPFDAQNDAVANAQSQKTWWYRTTFSYNGTGEAVRLNFEGVCDRADFWLNGIQIGEHQGMFGGPYLDVTQAVRQGENELVVPAQARLEIHRHCGVQLLRRLALRQNLALGHLEQRLPGGGSSGGAGGSLYRRQGC